MKPYVPHFGPYAGRACYRHDDGRIELAPEVDSAHAPPAVALPAEAYGYDEAWYRETVGLMQGQLVEAGHTPDRAKEIAVNAAMRNAHGQMGRPYTPRS